MVAISVALPAPTAGHYHHPLLSAAGRHFDVATGVSIATRLTELIRDDEGLDQHSMFLVRGATEYFLLVDDGEHDVNAERGFDDDMVVLEAVELHLGPLKQEGVTGAGAGV